MKLLKFLWTVPALLVACTVEPCASPCGELTQMVFSASCGPIVSPPSQSRTALEADKSVSWTSGDEISVFDSEGNREFTLTSVDAYGTGSFSGSAVAGKPKYLAAYPYAAANNWDTSEDEIRIAFVSAQKAGSPGTFAPGYNPSVALLKDGHFAFKNIGGLLRFSLSLDNVSCVTLSANDGGTVGGTYDIGLDSDGNIASTTLISSGTTLTLTPLAGSVLEAGDYYFCLSARTYTGGITLSLDLDGGGSVSVGTTADVVVQRAKITSVGSIATGPDRPKRALTFTPIESLNQATPTPLSHYAWADRSKLSPIAGTYQTLGLDLLLGGESKPTDKPLYPRFTKAGSRYLMSYHISGGGTSNAGNECRYIYSTDLTDWTYGSKFFNAKKFTDCLGGSNTRTYAGANLLTLADGRVLAVASTRANSGYFDRNADGGLAIRYSSDNGATWGDEQIVYVGTNWEPLPIQLSDGRIQIYYTDSQKLEEGAFGSGVNVITTGTSYIESSDNGSSWSYGVVDRASHKRAFAKVRYIYDDEGDGVDDGDLRILTDQMPAVVQLQGGNHLVAAAESATGGADYTYYISLAWSDGDGSWGLPGTWGVLPLDRSDDVFEGCAPALVQFPSGETVLAYNRSNVFYMRQGDAQARNFGAETRVWTGKGAGFWGGLYALDSHRMIAGIGGTDNVMQIGQFYLNHAIRLSSHAVTVDSVNDDWSTDDEALWLCSGGSAKATVRASLNGDRAYFLFEVSDDDISDSDYVELYLSDPSTSVVGATSLRVRAGRSGLVSTARYTGGSWTSSAVSVSVRSAYDGTPGNDSDSDHGWLVEMSVPVDAVPRSAEQWLANFALYDAGNGAVDSFAPVASTSTAAWIPLLGVTTPPMAGISEDYLDYASEYTLE